MCRVKRGNDIKTEQDVQNLITAIILRQTRRYTRKYLIEATNYYMPNQKIKIIVNNKQMTAMIDNTLDTFRRYRKIKFQDGYIYPIVSCSAPDAIRLQCNSPVHR